MHSYLVFFTLQLSCGEGEHIFYLERFRENIIGIDLSSDAWES